MSEIISLSLEQLTSKIKDAQLSSVDVCKAFIERIEKFEKDITEANTLRRYEKVYLCMLWLKLFLLFFVFFTFSHPSRRQGLVELSHDHSTT